MAARISRALAFSPLAMAGGGAVVLVASMMKSPSGV